MTRIAIDAMGGDHAPFEIVSKTDVYMAYRAFFTFFDAKD